jgi:adenylate cyclase
MSEPGKESPLSSFLDELRRRRVIRVAVVYAIAGWIIIEVASTVLPPLGLPPWSVKLVIVLIALGFPIAVIMGWMFDLDRDGVQRTGSAAASKKPAHAAELAARDDEGRRTIAVLPFVNMSDDAQNEYFSDGISEEILNLLSKLPQLKVSSRTSSFFFKGTKINIPMVANELAVSAILEGSVRRAGDRVRITAQLIDAASDSHLWSETYDREFKDVFAIQDDIAKSIADALQVTLTPKERRSIQYVATSDAQAYDYYLRGRKYFYAMSRRDFHHAISMYQRAIELDPEYAAAWAGQADAYSYLYRFADASLENAAKAIEASERAVQRDPDSAEAHASSGLAHFINKKYADAERHFEAAIKLNPNLLEGYLFYAEYCSSQGDFEKAAKLFIQASTVNPADYQPLVHLALAYSAMGRKNDEIDVRRHALRIIQQHLQMNPDDVRARYMGACMFAVLGEREKAIEWANLALQSGADEPHVLYNVACTFAQLGENDRAMDQLEQAVKLGWGDRSWIENDSDLISLRGNERFKALLAHIN